MLSESTHTARERKSPRRDRRPISQPSKSQTQFSPFKTLKIQFEFYLLTTLIVSRPRASQLNKKTNLDPFSRQELIFCVALTQVEENHYGWCKKILPSGWIIDAKSPRWNSLRPNLMKLCKFKEVDCSNKVHNYTSNFNAFTGIPLKSWITGSQKQIEARKCKINARTSHLLRDEQANRGYARHNLSHSRWHALGIIVNLRLIGFRPCN